jgi:hypothetical protein
MIRHTPLVRFALACGALVVEDGVVVVDKRPR